MLSIGLCGRLPEYRIWRERADEDWRSNPKLSTKDLMISGLKGGLKGGLNGRDLREEFTARPESTKFADVNWY